ncbi:MAG: integrase core domain-containing protein [Reyranella sp.]|nr:integrase core domain-containing protein [Reyranella sp.]
MPWRETCRMDERVKFMAAWLEGEESRSSLCARHGISRKTGYKWASRYAADPLGGLANRTHVPLNIPHKIEAGVAALIVALRRQRPSWGPRKLRAALMRREPERGWPAASTIGDLLRREGLVQRRRCRSSPLVQTQPFAGVTQANDTWCVDFKGWFRTGDGQRCDPLTVSDAYSRYLLSCRIVPPTGEGVQPVIERLLREHGLPGAIRSDNGPPFASTAAGGLSRLSVSWLKLGIRLERIEPGCPQQNGRHERMHRTLKAETARPPAADPVAQQVCFDVFRQVYNEERPHEALGQVPPATVWRPSLRSYPARIEDPVYRPDHAMRRVRSNGEIKWGGDLVFISEALIGELVGVAETEAGDWIVRFIDVDLGIIDRTTRKLRRFTAPRPGRREAGTPTQSVTHPPGP